MENNIQTKLVEKSNLLKEMLLGTQAFSRLLRNTSELTDELLAKLVNFLENRDDLIQQIDRLDQELVALGSQVRLGKEDLDVLSKLQTYQQQISGILNQSKVELGQELSKIQNSREGLKGYYNQHVASNSSFIDDKR